MNALSLYKTAPPLASFLRLVACAAGLGFAVSSYAACVPSATVACIANQPIQSTTVVKPNLMFVLDNSGSMDWDYMPDSATFSDARRKNYQENTVYYNPNINYSAIVPNKPNATTGAIEFFPSQSFDNAQCDPYVNTAGQVGCANYAATTVNLSTSFKAYSGDAGRAAYYCKKIGTAVGAAPCARAGYQRVDVGASSCVVSGDVTSCPTGADERGNFAQWFSYYRTRILMMKSGMASAFAPLDDSFRIGFYTINSPTSNATATNGSARNIQDFSGGATGTPKGDWYAALFRMRPASGTPLQQALDRIGQYYSGSPPTGLSGDPIQYSCQKNFTIMSSDGGWNGANTGRGNWDKNVPLAMPIKEGNSVYDPLDTGLTQGDPFPMPFYEGASANTDTVADIAMRYWVNDLRTSGPVAANNVPVNSGDPAYWQHMNTFTIGLGVKGSLTPPNESSTGDWCALQNPANLPSECLSFTGPYKSWPVTPNGGNGTTTGTVGLAKFDDLWHAAINGRAKYYSATDPTSLATGLSSALRSIADAPTYGVGPSSSTSDFKSPEIGDYTTYVSSYRIINWSGDVKKYDLDRATGLKTGSALWSASYQLDRKVNPGLTSTVSPTGYTARNIITRTEDGVPVDFTYSTISTSQQAALCYKATPGTGPCITTDPDNASLVNYLRGDATWEGTYGVGNSRFRDRHDATEASYFKRDLIGSIVNAQPAYVAAEAEIYQDAGYAAYKVAKKTRSPTVYVGANDGMMHALDAATGDELWAYVPSFIIPTATDENGREKGLRALSYQDSGAPAYNHHFYLDGPLESGSIDSTATGGPPPYCAPAPCTPTPNWSTILVGGLGKGGKGYYALDVTNPATSLSEAKASVLWEFPSAADTSHSAVISGGLMGYSFGRPIITKTHAYGWVVMLPSGYNNSDGYGYVFVLNAKTGALLETLKTPTQAPGMAHITMLAKATNKFALQVYAGDLNGSVWRFDFGQTPLVPRVSEIFTSSSSTPIATEVNVSIDGNNGDRWIFFGTGQYLDVPDRATTGTQYLVALRDGTLGAPRTTVPPVALTPVPLATLSTVSDLMTGVVSAPSGWKYALPASGERIAFKPKADLRTVVFASLIPTSDPCSPGFAGTAYALEYSTGASRMMEGKTLVPSYYSASGISSADIQLTGKGPGTSGKVQLKICGNDGDCVTRILDTRKLYSGTRHIGWRELLNEF